MTWHHLFINPASFFIFKPVEGHISISRPGFKPGQQIDYEAGLLTRTSQKEEITRTSG